jgi:hypothetical protein
LEVDITTKDSSDSLQDSVIGSYECDNEKLAAIKGGEFLHELKDCQSLKKAATLPEANTVYEGVSINSETARQYN